MDVKIRQKQRLKSDKITLALEVYTGYTKNAEGKIRAIRETKKLDYFLYSNPKTPSEKSHNKESLRKAEALKGQTLTELLNGKYGFKTPGKNKASFVDYFKKLTNERSESLGNYGNWDSALKHLEKYCHPDTTFNEVTVEFVEGFKEYLTHKAKMKTGKKLSTNSALSYFNKLRAAINKAYDDGIINDNPVRKVGGIKQEETMRHYLTIDEIKALVNKECRYEVLKNAFLFSCLSGLRWSDIQKMTWSQVESFNGGWRINFAQKKTKGIQYHDIPDQAKHYMGEQGNAQEKVFQGLSYSSYMNVALTQWMLKAGITKPITFHCARHSFATMLLNLGEDLYTVSKLLGHSEIKTTQIYAKIMDQKKIDAVNKIPNILS